MRKVVNLSVLCADACFTLGKIVSGLGWKFEWISTTEIAIYVPEQDEDMFEFICGEFI